MRIVPVALIATKTTTLIMKYKRKSRRFRSGQSSQKKPRSNNSRKNVWLIGNPSEDRKRMMMTKTKRKSHQKFQMVHMGNSQRAKSASKWTAYRHTSHGKYATRITTCGSKVLQIRRFAQMSRVSGLSDIYSISEFIIQSVWDTNTLFNHYSWVAAVIPVLEFSFDFLSLIYFIINIF